ncbi:polysaccharide deacetylase [Christiangramia fulva]|uniref:Polysaccharide deacetylase n=1 Tax=Christiangramia fulva TaxID=2126553 RepID=A0A2R3Z9D5_9FLAO|nr:polysaccharide deacetylase family protein [Christiangramia fulva]AVR46895.1 polysaccharide deacetylase [Christiangramia fulva]
MNQKKYGIFTISLDFELLWGVFDHTEPSNVFEYFSNTKKLIPELLKEFSQHNIHVTWAVVGMLFNKGWDEWKRNIPVVQSVYENSKLSAYNFGMEFKADPDSEIFCFAPELIDTIKKTPGQEIGTHTYSHYYCGEKGQDVKQFEADLETAVKLATEQGISLKSLVFPRNQLNEDYLKVCYQYGIENVRSNPSSWYWKNPLDSNLPTKIARTGDAYVNFGKKTYPLSNLQRQEGMPLQQPASRFFRPYEENFFLHNVKMRRILNEMENAAKNAEIYHLWWHPHNFGNHPQESLKDLKSILDHFSKLKEKYNFQSLNMQEIGAKIS